MGGGVGGSPPPRPPVVVCRAAYAEKGRGWGDAERVSAPPATGVAASALLAARRGCAGSAGSLALARGELIDPSRRSPGGLAWESEKGRKGGLPPACPGRGSPRGNAGSLCPAFLDRSALTCGRVATSGATSSEGFARPSCQLMMG